MNLPRGWSVGVTLFAFAVGVAGAAALDTSQNALHRSKTASRLKETHHTTAHHAAAKSTAAHSSAAHVSATHAATTHSAASRVMQSTLAKRSTAATAGAHLRRASITRRHRYYERFTASSFVVGGVGADDITAGEDPVFRS